jgi:uncharacterized protein (DUF1778 family)
MPAEYCVDNMPGARPESLHLYGNLPYTWPMASATKSDRIELRLTSEQKSEIEQAAALSGRSVTDFSVSLLVREAGEVIRVERDLRMSKKSWDAFNEILDRPAMPVSGLADLLKRPSVFTD